MLAYDYGSRRALLEDPPDGEISPHLYALCTVCAERLRPPLGWELLDLRIAPPRFAPRLRPEPHHGVGDRGLSLGRSG